MKTSQILTLGHNWTSYSLKPACYETSAYIIVLVSADASAGGPFQSGTCSAYLISFIESSVSNALTFVCIARGHQPGHSAWVVFENWYQCSFWESTVYL